MKKAIIIIFIAGLALFFNHRLQNYSNQAIIKKAPNDQSKTIEGYFSGWDSGFIRIINMDEKEQKASLSADTIFLRTYVNKENNLLQRESIGANDLIKDQFIAIDGYEKEGEIKALIIRQIIYVEE